MMKNVVVYFSITTKPTIMIFDGKSISPRIYGQWIPQWAHTIDHVEI